MLSVSGEWSTWTSWSVCSVNCGGGITRRIRNCNNPKPANGGDDCEGPAVEVESCFTHTCDGGTKIKVLKKKYI